MFYFMLLLNLEFTIKNFLNLNELNQIKALQKYLQ